MSNKTIKVRITNEELFALGFERVIYNGKEYVDKSPLFLDSTCPLSSQPIDDRLVKVGK